jgi:para-nitrobenzyl esterase
MKWQTALCLVLTCSMPLTFSCINDNGSDDDWDGWGSGGGGWGGGGWGDDYDDYDDDYDEGDLFDDNPMRVRTRSGGIEGALRNSTRMFLGVPYAAAPVGDLRWKAPQAYANWGDAEESIRDAKSFGARCAQNASSVYKSSAPASEDCLFMNVWTPNEPVSKKLPVMVFIHGGEHAYGSSSDSDATGELYDGEKLSEKGVVVASFNYRLGALGFFPHPDLQQEDGTYGNQGLLDQVHALKWIKENISAFNGDPSNVTIFGQGSGAQDVCLHMVSPQSRGLFQRAIGESGGCTDYQPQDSDVRAGLDKFLKNLKCDGQNALKCMRSHKVDEVIAAMPKGNENPFKPFIDGVFLRAQPRDSFESGDVAKAAYILGTNTNEGSAYSATYGNVTTQAAFEAVLQQYFPAGALPDIGKTYSQAQYADAQNPYQTALSHAFGDGRTICPTWDTATRAYEAGADVYVYSFAGVANQAANHANGALGTATSMAEHGAELGHVFGHANSTEAQKALTDIVQRYWTNFATYGDPNDSSVYAWPAYSNVKRAPLNLTSTLGLAEGHDKECALWSSIYASQFPTATPVKVTK